MKILKQLIALFKTRRNSEIDYEYCNYKYNSFFRVLLFKWFGIVTKYPEKYRGIRNGAITIFNRPGSIWDLPNDALLKAPLGFLIGTWVFNGKSFRKTILKRLGKENFEDREYYLP